VDEKAVVFSLEAAISLIALLAIITAAARFTGQESLMEIILLQKEDDLLKAWAKQGILEEEKMVEDFLFVFPEHSGRIIVNKKEIILGEEKGRAISSSITLFSSSLEKTEITLIVFY
jgi:hypothetical protein